MNRIMVIAENEFRMSMKNPIILASLALLIVMSIIISSGFTINASSSVKGSEESINMLSVFMRGQGGGIYEISSVFAILSVCIGIFSIAEERFRGTLNTLICKPVYRRDIILGKFIGLSGFLLMLISFVLAIRASLGLILYPMPYGLYLEIFSRIISMIIALFLLCMVMLGISMMIGALFKNIALIITISATLVYLQWFTPIIDVLPTGFLDPKIFYIYYILVKPENNIFSSSSPYLNWLLIVFPYFVFLALEAIIAILIDCVLFNRMET